MIDFDLTEEQRLLEQTVREWGAREVAPQDPRSRSRAPVRPRTSCRRWRRSGCSASRVPAEYGGAGMDYISLGLASEELEYVDTSLRVIMSVHAGLNCLSLLTWGTEDQKQRYLVPQAQGKKIATYGLTEPAAGSDVARHPDGRDQEGRSLLPHRREDVDLARRRRRQLPGVRLDAISRRRSSAIRPGISAFIVERAFKGFSSGTLKEKWGILAGNTGFFKMDDVEVPEENLLGRPGEGFKIAMFALDQGRYTVAAGATGLIRACRDASAKYAKERKTFGVEIGQHQLVKEMIAQMESDYQASRLLWLRAGWLKNIGRRNTRETGLAKWFSTVASERAAGDAVQIHGANGYSDEYPVGRFYRNCKGAVIYEGTREIHKLMQADYVLGYREDRPTRCELPPFERPGDGELIETRSLRAVRLTAHPQDPSILTDYQSSANLWSSWSPICRSSSCASSSRPPSPARTRWGRAIATSPTRWRSRRCAQSMDTVPIDGTIVIGEGERDEAPMLFIGEKVGLARSRHGRRPACSCPAVDIAVDPLEGTNLCATGCAERHRRARRVAARAACCTRPTSTWRSWSSGPARSMR